MDDYSITKWTITVLQNGRLQARHFIRRNYTEIINPTLLPHPDCRNNVILSFMQTFVSLIVIKSG
jgi:hypothetical protein